MRLFTCAMANIRLILLDQLRREIKEPLEVIGRIRDRPGFEPKPTDHLEDRLKVGSFFR